MSGSLVLLSVSPYNLVANCHNPNKHCLPNCFCQNLFYLVNIYTFFNFILLNLMFYPVVLRCRKYHLRAPVCCLTSGAGKIV